ncbi:hypothetical protein Tco_0895423 [Tanacetum coccineum]|uniref:Uncharacterized protein n=1 Tax=Tanacetum coccineum TaxID=301880 RepID=A0ABQ5CI10_9ASTR
MSGEEPATQIAPVESPQMVSTIKLLIFKKGEYTLWSMRMEQYLTNTYYSLWQVILNGDGSIQVTTDEKCIETEVPPKTAQALLQRQRERKAKIILIFAIPDEYQLRFHGIKDAKSLWAAIKSRFGGNVESKKMQKTILKKNFENFFVSNTEGLDKAYDRFQKLISLLEVHGAAVPNEDNVAFLSAKDTSSSNEVNTANSVSTASGHNSQGQASSSSYTDDLMFSFFANQSNSPQLDDEDLEQIDHDNLEEMDLKWKAAMLSMRVKRFYEKTRRKLIFNGKEPIANKNGDAGYRSRDNTRRTVPVKTSDALVVQDNALIIQDGLGYDWSYIAQDEPTEFALIAYTSNSSGSDTEVQSCSKNYVKTYEKLQKQFDEQRQTLSKANLEIIAYQSGLESVEAHQLSSKDKTGLGYEDQLNENDSSGSELFNSVFDSHLSDGDDNQTNDKFKKDNGYHVVPPPLIGNYIPPLADLSFARLDDPVYRPTTNKTSASVSQVEKSTSQTRNTNVEMPKVESVRPSGVIIEDWIYSMAGSDDEIPPPPPPQTSTQQAPHIVSTIKLPILKKGEYDIWAMKMEHYLSHTDYPIWEVIQKGNGPDAIKSRFGGNDESKKMQKYILKQQFEGFSVSNSEGLHKGYDRFQSLLSQLEIHGAGVSTEDANQKFLRVFESNIKRSTGSSSSARNIAIVSFLKSTTLQMINGLEMASGHDFHEIEEVLQEDIEKAAFDAKEPVRFDKTKEEPKALVTLDREGVDWTDHAEDEQENFALMAYSNLGSHTEVTSCSKECVESYAKFKKLYDEQREQLGDASIEIQAYTQALKKVEAQFVTHQKNQLWSSDVEDSHVHDIFANVEGMHAFPPLMTGNYMPLGPDREIDDSMFTYGPKQSKTSESDTQTSNYDSCESNSSTETLESVPEPVIVEPYVVSQPKVCPDAPIIEEYESDSDDEYVIQPSKEQKRPSFAFIDTVKHVKTPKETVK